MQTTLLGFAITVILALLAALVGPLFVDWDRYRPHFEAEASRLVGLPVRVSGSVDVRLLPSPSLILGGIEIGEASAADKVKARALGVEFALGPLLRGQFRAAQTRIIGPEFTLGLDRDGQLVFPKIAGRLALDALAIDRLNIDDARVVLGNAANGARAALDKFWFHGEVRSLAGAFKGEGAFILNGGLYGYRIAANRADESGVRAKFSVDPSDQPVSAEGEGLFTLENGRPRFEGTVNVARAAGAVLSGGQAVMNEPLRISSRVKANPSSALLEQLEFQYGPDERAVKLAGTAQVAFGANPRLDSVLSARQLDLDRLLASADRPRRLPLSALKELKETFGLGLRLPVPARIGIGIDSLVLSGATLQSVRGDLNVDAAGWSLDHVEFRAPGFTQVQLSGTVDANSAFAGPVDVASAEPRALLAWLDGRSDPAPGTIKPIRARGDVTLGADRIAIERFHAEIDRKGFDGRIAYRYSGAERKARLDAELRAADFDADSIMDFGKALFGDKGLDRPGELSLAFDFGRARIAGFEAKEARAKLTLDANGLQVERLAVADFGGIGLSGSGTIDTSGPAPRGNLSLDLDARGWSGASALLAKFAPQIEEGRRMVEKLGPAKLHAALNLDNAAQPGRTQARLAIEGNAGTARVDLKVDATANPDKFAQADLRVEGMIASDDARDILRLAGFDHLAGLDGAPGHLTLSANGPLGGTLRLDSRLTAGAVDAGLTGTISASLDREFGGIFGLTVKGADIGRLRPGLGIAPGTLPADLKSRLTVAGKNFTLDDLTANVAGVPVRGRLAFGLGAGSRVSGSLQTDELNAQTLIAAAIGWPSVSGEGYFSESFRAGVSPDFDGRIEFRATRVQLSPTLAAANVKATIGIAPAAFSIDDVSGDFAGGRLSGALSWRKRPDGLNMQGRANLAGIDAGILNSGGDKSVQGRLGLQVEAEGVGLTPKALAGSLAGSGTITLENAELARLDPRVFSAAMRAADQGAPLDPNRLRDVVAPALDRAPLKLKHAEGTIAIANGQARIGTVIARAEGADLAMSGNVDLAERAVDARLTLTANDTVTLAGRPELTVTLKGPVEAPRRALEVPALAGWLALRAVEQQSKKLEAIEAERSGGRATTQSIAPARSPASAASAASPAARAAPLPPPIQIAPQPRPGGAPKPSASPTQRDLFMNQFGSQR